LEEFMAYALFEGDDQLSRAFPTQKACWDHAEHAGLIDKESERLEVGLTSPCPDDKSIDAKSNVDGWELPQLEASDMNKRDLMRHADSIGNAGMFLRKRTRPNEQRHI
jgi:hypothetical protein